MFELITSLFGGGLTGLIGSVVSRIFDYKTKQLEITANQQKFAHDLAMRKADAEIMAQEWAARTRVAEVETAGREAVADAQAFAESFKEPPRYSAGATLTPAQTWLLVILDFTRGMVRPGLTIYLCVITTMVYLQARWLLGPGIKSDDSVQILNKIIAMILYLTTTCVLWWFGTRSKQAPPKV